ncbi:MAG: tetratricopeptide repeat protein [Treponema sp.]|nr:tetratricopeptide repeat protein [Treponema sp.]
MKKNIVENKNLQRKENKALKKAIIITSIVVVLGALITTSVFLIRNYYKNKITVNDIREYWQQYDYESVYEYGKRFLQDDPFNNTVLTYYGYSCFFLAVAQNDNLALHEYLDESINKMRLALYDAKDDLKPQLQYMLGKAYYFKNTSTTYYYADLAVKYLNLAKMNGYEADDINERLGLSYAALGKTKESIAAFSEALLVRESDSLLLAIAEQYYKSEDLNVAEQYLYRVLNSTTDDDNILKARLIIAQIYTDREEYDKALEEYESILEKYKDCADAYYGIGVVYEMQNNKVKARAEWIKALRIQVNHPGAQKKLSIY